MEDRDVVIIGAGIAGMTAAKRLRDLDPLVLEASDRVGGRVRTEAVDGFLIDRGFQASDIDLGQLPHAQRSFPCGRVRELGPATLIRKGRRSLFVG